MSDLKNRIRHRDAAGVRRSVAGGADLSRKDRSGRTPLHVAAECDALDIARILMEHGAPLDARDAQGRLASDLRPGSQTSRAIQQAIYAANTHAGRPGATLGPLRI